MAFYLTSNITIGDYQKVKPNKITWKTDVSTFTDTCTITLPRITHMVNNNDDKTLDINGQKIYQFKEGDKVSVDLGYNMDNNKRFEGFVSRIKMGIPVELECEGYAYQLYDIIFNKTYANITVRQLLNDLTIDTDIKLSEEIPEIPLKNVRFKNATGIQVLEWLKKECSLSIYFNFNELFVGTTFGKVQKTVKIKIGYNTIKDDDFQERKLDKNVKIVIKEKNAKGEVKKTKNDEKKHRNEKEIKIKAGMPANYLQEIVNRLQSQDNYKGYEGSIQLFLVPYINKGMVIELDGGMYPNKSGNFFVQSVQGEFGMSGGRQTIQLGFLMNK